MGCRLPPEAIASNERAAVFGVGASAVPRVVPPVGPLRKTMLPDPPALLSTGGLWLAVLLVVPVYIEPAWKPTGYVKLRDVMASRIDR